MKEKFADARRTVIEEGEFEHDIKDLIQREDMVVTVTNTDYVKRVPLSTYRAQRRGGKGRAGMSTHEEDFVNQVFVDDDRLAARSRKSGRAARRSSSTKSLIK